MKIKDCMTNKVSFCTPNDTVYKAVNIMNECEVGCVPVCDDQKSIVGIITDRDIILRGIACDKDVKTTKASDIMTCNVCTCSKDDDIYDAELKMANNQIRRIPVVDNNKIIGILTFGDLTHYYDEIGEDEFCSTVENICECGGQAKNNC